MKNRTRLCALSCAALLTFGTCAPVMAAEPELILYGFAFGESGTTKLEAYGLGSMADGVIDGLNTDRIYVDGAPIDDDIRMRTEPDTAVVTADGLSVGQTVYAYDLAHPQQAEPCVVTGLDFWVEGASGEDMFQTTLKTSASLVDGAYLVLPVERLLYPRPIKTTFDVGEGTLYIAEVDFDGDGTVETLRWDSREDLPDGDGTQHPIHIMRGDTELGVLSFFYDFEYTNPENPALVDLNGDGVYELVLSGNGHNVYCYIYTWQDDGFRPTQARYYSGD